MLTTETLDIVGVLMCAVPFIALPLGFFFVVNRIARSRQRKRHEVFRAVAERLGLEFAAPGKLPASYAGGPAGAVAPRTVPFLISGAMGGVPVWACETFGGRDSGSTGWFTATHGGDYPLTIFVPLGSGPFAAVRSNASAWQMQGRGITVLEFPGDPLGERFAKRYSVLATDAAFARALCTPEIMTYLLEHPGLKVSVLGNTLRLTHAGRLKTETTAAYLEHLVALRNLLPTAPAAEHPVSGERPA